jgi:hypothetical protein
MRVHAAALAALTALIALAAGQTAGGAISSGPAVTVTPSVSGTIAAGRRLTALTGTWAGSGPIRYGFQWYRCDGNGARCNRVTGATSATYLLVARDVGKTIGLAVVATDAAGSTTAYASLVGPIAQATPLLVSTAQPTVSGAPVQGKIVQASTGAWSPTPAKITYAWLRCNVNGRVCARISDATGSSYTVGALDVGHALVALVQASFGTTVQSAFSTATVPVVAATVVGPTRISGPSVSGTAAQGRQLIASPGTWTGIDPISFAYQWYRCDASGAHCTVIRGATRSTYTLVRRDNGKTVGLTLGATDASGTATAYAGLVGPVAPMPSILLATIQPSIAGDPRSGQRLTVSPGTWSPTPMSFAYAWQRCNTNGRVCVPIPGANAPTYVVGAADAGRGLAVVVTASSAGGSQSALSTSVAVR